MSRRIEYEYAVQWVSKEAGGRTIPVARHEWGDLETAKRNQEQNQKRLPGRFNFVIVRRRKAGPLEAMPDEAGQS